MPVVVGMGPKDHINPSPGFVHTNQSPDLGLSLSNISPSVTDRRLFLFWFCDCGPVFGSIRFAICIEGMGWVLGLDGLGPEDVGLGGYCIGG